MKKLKSVFWDVDGTIADTEMYGHRIAFNNAFSYAGLNWSWDILEYTNLLQIQGGLNRIKYYANSKNKEIDSDKCKYLHSLKQKYYRHLIQDSKVPIRRGVKRLVKELYASGVSQWIVTTSSRNAVEPLISNLFGITSNPFNGCITYEDVCNHKPYPDAYNKAINMSQTKREDILVIEDSVTGLRSADAALLKCLLTMSPWSKYDSNSMAKATAVLDHLGDSLNPCKVFHGINCKIGQVTLEYLEQILSLD